MSKQNFIIFFPDEMRASSVSCYGNKIVKMPNYDRLASEGTLFENCIVQNPVCTPSRCSLMTGLYPHNAGHRTLWHLLRPHEPSLFRYLKNAGYHIQWYGKNDLYSQEYLNEICDDIDEMRHGYKTAPTLKSGHVKSTQRNLDPSDEHFYSFLYPEVPEDGGELTIDEKVARAVDFIKSRKPDDKPFMLFLPTSMPHPPYSALESFHNMYKPEDVTDELIEAESLTNPPEYMKLLREYRRSGNWSKEYLAKIYAVYLGMNSYVDKMLGLILDTLETTGLDQTTTVIASSDHGDYAGDYGLMEKWPNAMEDDLVRVPLIIKSPGIKQGNRIKGQVELFDIMPTVMELAELDCDHVHFAKTLVPELSGLRDDLDRPAFCEGGYDPHEPHCFEGYIGRKDRLRTSSHIYYPKALQQQEHPETISRTTMIRMPDYKLVRRTSGDNQLYDLKADPGERNNLYNVPEYDAKKRELEDKLLSWYIHTSDTVPRNDDPRDFK